MRQNSIPTLDTHETIEIDRLMIDTYGITLMQIMENAGRNLAMLAKQLLGGSIIEKKICVAVGDGNNGGSGLVAVRHLSNWGANVTCLVTSPIRSFKYESAQQLEIIRQLPVSVVPATCYAQFIDWANCNLIIDAIYGYGFNEKIRRFVGELVKKINQLPCPVLALDSPSGLNTNNACISQTVVKADATLTLGLPKKGLLTPQAKEYVGTLYLGDISVPPQLYKQLGIVVNSALFAKDMIIPYKNMELSDF